MPSPGTILIAGVGNLLLSDDGVGVHALRELEKVPLPGVSLAEIGTAILHGLPWLEQADRVLLIDAARGGQPPGTIYLFDVLPGASTPAMSSLHALGLCEAARVLLSGRPAPPITVLGVEPESLDYGMELSGTVRAALARVVGLARETVKGWGSAVPEEPAACRAAA